MMLLHMYLSCFFPRSPAQFPRGCGRHLGVIYKLLSTFSVLYLGSTHGWVIVIGHGSL